MGISKINLGSKTLIDLTKDSVSASTLVSGITAHDKAGNTITGSHTESSGLDTSDANAESANILEGKTAYVKGSKITGTMTNRGAITNTISTKGTSIIVTEGYHNGNGRIQIAKEEQDKIIPANIRKGVTILGQEGECAESTSTEVDKTGKGEYIWRKCSPEIGWVETKTSTGSSKKPSGYGTTEYKSRTITSDGYYQLSTGGYGLDKLYLPSDVENGKAKNILYKPYGYNTSYQIWTLSDEKGETGNKGDILEGYVSSLTDNVYPNSGVQDHYYYSKIFDPNVSVTASKMLENTVACGQEGKITGTIKSQAAQTITPGTSDQTIASGVYLSGTQTVKGDANLLEENIKAGVSIFGKTGTYTGGDTSSVGGSNVKTGSITASGTDDIVINTGLSSISIFILSIKSARTSVTGVQFLYYDENSTQALGTNYSGYLSSSSISHGTISVSGGTVTYTGKDGTAASYLVDGKEYNWTAIG